MKTPHAPGWLAVCLLLYCGGRIDGRSGSDRDGPRPGPATSSARTFPPSRPPRRAESSSATTARKRTSCKSSRTTALITSGSGFSWNRPIEAVTAAQGYCDLAHTIADGQTGEGRRHGPAAGFPLQRHLGRSRQANQAAGLAPVAARPIASKPCTTTPRTPLRNSRPPAANLTWCKSAMKSPRPAPQHPARRTRRRRANGFHPARRQRARLGHARLPAQGGHLGCQGR